MKLDLQTMGKSRYITQDKNDKNMFRPAKGYIFIVDDEWKVQWITWDIYESKFKAESLDGDEIYVRANTRAFDVYKKLN